MAATEHDTEQGFGTGLRAQLKRRQDAEEPAAEPEPPETSTLPPAAEAVELPDFAEAELAALRRELAEVHAREQEARAELADLRSRLEQDVTAAQAMSLRSAEVDQRAAKLAAQQAELEERERELGQRAEAAAAEQQRLADLKAELAAAETRTAEREKQISLKLRELTNADRERTEAATELAKLEAALAQRERALERTLAEIEGKAAEATARVDAREAVLVTRETMLRDQESEHSERDRQLAERERELVKARATVTAREEHLESREAELKAKTDRLTADLERLAEERSGSGEVVAAMSAKRAEITAKESELAAREAELNRRESQVRREEAEGQTSAHLEEEARRIDDLRRELAAREAEITSSETLFESQRARVERREKRLGQTEEAISDRIRKKGKKPKAIILVHLYGMPARIDEIMAVARKYEIPVIEDAAEALGATYKGKKVGTFGDLGVYSFNGNKIITTSGGGALVSDNKAFVDKARFLATQARDPAPHYEHSEIGFNYRLSNVCAAIGRGQLLVLDERISQRRSVFNFYRDALGNLPGFGFLLDQPPFSSNRWLSTVLVDPHKTGGITNEILRQSLENEHIETRPLWKPMHLQPVYAGAITYLNGLSQMTFAAGLCLPSGSSLKNSDLQRITEIISILVTKGGPRP